MTRQERYEFNLARRAEIRAMRDDHEDPAVIAEHFKVSVKYVLNQTRAPKAIVMPPGFWREWDEARLRLWKAGEKDLADFKKSGGEATCATV